MSLIGSSSLKHSHDLDCENYYLQHAATVDTGSGQAYGCRLFSVAKRVSDIIIGTICLTISLPVIVLFGIFIKLEDGGSVFYAQ